VDTLVNALGLVGLIPVACMTVAYGAAVAVPPMILGLAWMRPHELPSVCWPEKQQKAVPAAPAERAAVPVGAHPAV